MKDVIAFVADRFGSRYAGDFFGGRIETGNHPVAVDGKNTIGDGP
jgi:hypothetical protein